MPNTLDGMAERVRGMEQRLDRDLVDRAEVRRALFDGQSAIQRILNGDGNGNRGLLTRMATVENAIDQIVQDRKQRAAREWTIIAILLTLLANAAWQYLSTREGYPVAQHEQQKGRNG